MRKKKSCITTGSNKKCVTAAAVHCQCGWIWAHVVTHSEIQVSLLSQFSIRTLLIENIQWHYKGSSVDVFHFTGERGKKKEWTVTLICNFCCFEITVKKIDSQNKTGVWNICFICLSHAYWDAERYQTELRNMASNDKSCNIKIHRRNEQWRVSPFAWAAGLTSWSAANHHTWLSRCQRSSHCRICQRDALLGGKENKLAGVRLCFSFKREKLQDCLWNVSWKVKKHFLKTMQSRWKYTDCIENIVIGQRVKFNISHDGKNSTGVYMRKKRQLGTASLTPSLKLLLPVKIFL